MSVTCLLVGGGWGNISLLQHDIIDIVVPAPPYAIYLLTNRKGESEQLGWQQAGCSVQDL